MVFGISLWGVFAHNRVHVGDSVCSRARLAQCRGFGLRPLTSDIAESLGSMYVTFVHDEYAYPPGTTPHQFEEKDAQTHSGADGDGRMHASEEEEAEYASFLGLQGLSISRSKARILPPADEGGEPGGGAPLEGQGMGALIQAKRPCDSPARFDHVGRAINSKIIGVASVSRVHWARG